MTPRMRITSATEAVAAVPFALGFHPADSLVAVGLLGDDMVFAARYDLPPEEDAEALGRHLLEVAARQEVNGLALIGYGSEAQVSTPVQRVALAVAGSRVMLLDAVRVTDGQCWSYLCADDGCCPKPCPPPDNVVAFQATIAGQVALPDREALVAQFAPVTGEQRAAMAAATARAQTRLADEFGGDVRADDFARALRRTGRRAVRDAERRYRSGRPMTDDEVAWLAVTLVDRKVRDYAWERTGEEQWRIAMWTDVLRRVEPAFVPAPASLLSFAAWRNGMGSVARVAVDRALAGDPNYGMAGQMDLLLLHAVSPEMVQNWPMIDREPTDLLPEQAGSGRAWSPSATARRDAAQSRGRAERDPKPRDRRSTPTTPDRRTSTQTTADRHGIKATADPHSSTQTTADPLSSTQTTADPLGSIQTTTEPRGVQTTTDPRGAQTTADRSAARQPAAGQRTGSPRGRHAAPRKPRRRRSL